MSDPIEQLLTREYVGRKLAARILTENFALPCSARWLATHVQSGPVFGKCGNRCQYSVQLLREWALAQIVPVDRDDSF